MSLPPTTTLGLRTLARLRAGALQGAAQLDLRGAGLTELPAEVLALADTLEVLDVSGNALTGLPEGLACCQRLHTVFASGNRLQSVPAVLGRLPRLDTLGLKANQITVVPAAALAPTLRWLILTDNQVAEMPDSLTDCAGLQKLMLAGNRLRRWPPNMGRLRRLELVRLAANQFEQVADALPEQLLTLPRLAWLAHAGNPFSARQEQLALAGAAVTAIAWADLQVADLLGEGASGHIHAAHWHAPGHAPRAVAVKLFKATVTSDGLPQSEMAATLLAGQHPSLLGVLGVLVGHPQGRQGLVLPRLGPPWGPLAGPPSMASCTRDVYAAGQRWPADQVRAMGQAAATALQHLHDRGLSHGDLYAHNLLVDGQGGALLSDFGAASWLPEADGNRAAALQALDKRALQVLLDELAARA